MALRVERRTSDQEGRNYRFCVNIWPRICRNALAARASTPDHTGGTHDAPPDPLIGWARDISPQTPPYSAPRPSRFWRSGLPPTHNHWLRHCKKRRRAPHPYIASAV